MGLSHPFLTRPHRTLLQLSLPVMLSQIAEPLTGLVDTGFVARLGALPLASLGVGATFLSSVLWVFNFLSIGTQTELARAQGQRDEASARQVASLSLVLAVLLGTALGVLVWPIAPWAMRLMGLGEAGVAGGAAYLRVRLLGGPAVLLTVAAAGALRGRQDMATPLKIALLVNAVNLLIDPLLIFGIGPFPRLELVGAGCATSLAQWLGAGLSVVAVRRQVGLGASGLWHGAGRLFRLGLDLFLRTGALLLFLALATRAANRIDVVAGAAHQAIRQCWMLTAFLLDAYAIAAQSLVGFFLAGQHRLLARRVAKVACLWGFGTGLALGLLMLLSTPAVAALLVPASARLAFSSAWWVAALALPLNSLAFATDGIHWGTADYRFLRDAMAVATGVGALLLFLLQGWDGFGLATVWAVTAVWIGLRAGFGVTRIWPGFGAAPLRSA